MAQPTNTFDSYDMVGIREQLADTIDMISPDETPFYSKAGKGVARNTFVEWQTDSLRAAAANAVIEGDDRTASARTPTTRLGNYTQLMDEAVTISDTDMGLDKAGRGREMVRELMKAGKTVKLDIERHVFQNQARVAGNSTTARQMAAIQSWLATNTSHNGAGEAPTGDGTDARTAGTNRAFTQTLLNTGMQDAWNSGGKVDTLYASPSKVTAIAGFTGSNNQRNTVDKRELSYAVDVYMTSFGTVEIQPSRYCGDNAVYGIQSDKWRFDVLAPFGQKELAKTGHAEKRLVSTELTLCSMNEAASFAVYDLT